MIERLTNQTIVIRLDGRTALLLLLSAVAVALLAAQAYSLALQAADLVADIVPLIRSIHFNLVAAPFESAVNSARAAKEQLGE